MNTFYFSVLFFMLLPFILSAQSLREKVNEGNEHYYAGEYEQAVNKYKDALLDEPLNDKILFNEADALYKMQKYEEALDGFQKVLGSKDLMLASKAHFNIGNAYFQQNKLPQSIESYKKALELNPEDYDAKYNLELARAKLKEQSEKQQQNPQNQQNQEQQQEGQQQQQSDQQQDNPEDQQNEQDKQQQQEQSQEKQQQEQQQTEQQQAQQQEDQINKEEAERILNALKADEQDAQKNKAPVKAQGRVSGKDW